MKHKVEFTIEETQRILSALRIGQTSFRRDEGIDLNYEHLANIEQEYGHATAQLLHTLLSAEGIVSNKLNPALRKKYQLPTSRFDLMEVDE